MSVHLLNCFTCNSRVGNLKTGQVCLLLETDKGLTLIDTGLGLGDYEHPSGVVRIFRVLTQMPFDRNEAAALQIQNLGYKPEDVKHVVLTHMHFDHCGGLPDFPRANVHVHKKEYAAFIKRNVFRWSEYAYDKRYIAHQPEFFLYETINSRWRGFDAIRLPFEPEMYFVPLFGHSRGHCGVAVKTSGGWFFHAGDAGAVYDNTTPKWLIRLVLGPHDSRLREFMKTHPDVLVSNSHMRPEFFAQHPVVE